MDTFISSDREIIVTIGDNVVRVYKVSEDLTSKFIGEYVVYLFNDQMKKDELVDFEHIGTVYY